MSYNEGNYPLAVFLTSQPDKLAASLRASLHLLTSDSFLFLCMARAFPTAPICFRTSEGSTS
ncbi:hypothetical protein Hanom_Chr00s000003g01604981 [Helianthus anomalus]